MKIPEPDQIRFLDAETIRIQKINSADLMERAAVKCVDEIIQHYRLLRFFSSDSPEKPRFFIFAGSGNNGGDALVVARHLYQSGFEIFLQFTGDLSRSSVDFLHNKNKLPEGISIGEIDFQNLKCKSGDIVIDGIFGTGINKPIEGKTAELIHKINNCEAQVVSIDMPSGLFAEDNSGNDLKAIVRADLTLTFQFPKLAFLFPENEFFVGEWKILDIGLDKDSIDGLKNKRIYLTHDFVAHQLKPRNKFSHKGTFGHALLICGSAEKSGAAQLAVKACLRSGAGLTSVHVPEKIADSIRITCPEAMLQMDKNQNFISVLPKLDNYNVIGVGPGIGKEEETVSVIKKLVAESPAPLVIDADALNIISENKTWLSFIPSGTVLTPHPKEFDRLFGNSSNGYERLQKQKEASFKFSCFIVLKGAHTSISCPDGTLYFNSTGNSGLAKGGAGDALTGLITGMIASGYSSETASALAVYIHGLAADLLLEEQSQESIIITDLINYFGKAFNFLRTGA